LVFTEKAGERAEERGIEMSDERREILQAKSGIETEKNLSSLTSKLEVALTNAGNEDELSMSEEDIRRRAEEADDGW